MTEYDNFINNFLDNNTESGSFLSTFSTDYDTGVDKLFSMLYDSFCTDNVVNVNTTIPFTNDTFTISSEQISSFYPESIKSIVNMFFWGMLGLFIIKDIRTSLDKMSQGNIEHVSSDVMKEVL